MDSDQIISKMNTYLHTAANVLSDWLQKLLPRTSANWWEDCVMANLSYNQAETAIERGFTELGQFDLAALLRIANKSWYEMRCVAYLPSQERECIRDMIRVRNNWAHVSAVLPGKDSILADLDTLRQFFEQRECEDSLIREVEHVTEEVKHSFLVSTISASESPSKENAIEVSDIANEDEITEKSIVYLIGNPDVHGIVMSVADLGDIKKYEVFVDGNLKTFYSGQIALFEETPQYNWIDINTFRSYLTAYQINNPSGNNLYSLNTARIDFVPYQFRPALKLIHADVPRILIADSVGVGKTIEAGLIIKELQARNELENILVVCPKPLVTERKWEMEMKRFDEEFVPVDGPMLRQIISDTDRDGEWPVRFSKTIVPYSILDSRAYEGETTKKKHSFGLRDLDPAPNFDLVIIDEAHHIRNGSMEKEKAYEYKCVKYFCDHANAVVMLTATPLQTSDDDLFTLLNVLRPDVVIDKQTFHMMSKPNAHISKAARIIRKEDDHWQEQALEALQGVLETQWGENVISANPSFKDAVQTLQQDEITREERVKLISDTESLHSFNTMLNRTRRKDIQDFCIRRPYTLAVEFTERQKALYEKLLEFEQIALSQIHGSVRSVPFLMSTIKRQAASCIFGLAPHIRDLVQRRFQQLDDDPDMASEGFTFKDSDVNFLRSLAQDLLLLADDLPAEDPKFDKMLEAIREKQKQDNNKIIIFSTFRYTLAYLRDKLSDEGLRVAQIDGSVKDEKRQELRAQFELEKTNKDAIDILLFTEVGSEGLDYQFCNMMINYDLPWNPMKIEQRIGRIDRRGQLSETVSIYNMITDGTVDADIYYRCLNRIGIFESSIGECDEILGDIATQIEQIAMDPSLSENERKTKLEQMADNEVRRLQEMDRLEDEEKEFMGFDLSEYMTSMEIHNAENPWLTQRNLQLLIEQYLSQRLGKGSYILGEGTEKQLRLSADARAVLREDFRRLPSGRNSIRQTWDVYLKGQTPIHPITFDSETAEKRRDTFFITAVHPLAKQAAAYFASKTNDLAYIRLQYVTENLQRGSYHFSVYAWSYVGAHPHFRLVVVSEDDTIAAELPDILQEAQGSATAMKIDPSDWNELENKHVKLWRNERTVAIQEAKTTSSFKIESLSNNFRNRERSLNQKINDAVSESIRRMYMSELETAEKSYKLKVDEIEKQIKQTDIHTTLIANGILDVIN